MRLLIFIIVAASLLPSVPAWAAGMKQSAQGAKASGMADAFVGLADDPTAVYYNPAAMTRFRGVAAAAGLTVLMPRTTFEAGADIPTGVASPELNEGETVSTQFVVTPVPHAYALNRVSDSPLAVGFGVYLPFASGVEWDESWAGRGAGVKSQVAAAAFNPNIAIELHPNFSLAAGFSLYQSALEAKRIIRANIGNPAEDITANLGLEGQAYAGNAALIWTFMDGWTFGAAYRSAAKAELRGDADFTVPHPAYAETFPDQDVTAVLRFPDVLNAGIGWRPAEAWSVDAEIEFVRHNVHDRVVFAFATERPSARMTQHIDWRNTVAYRVGANYTAGARWDFRAGLAYEPSPVPDERFTPVSPDSDRLIAAAGATYFLRGNAISLALQWQHFSARTVSEADIEAGAADLPGTYRTGLPVVALTWAYAPQEKRRAPRAKKDYSSAEATSVGTTNPIP